MPGADEYGKPRRQWAPDARALSVVGDRWVMVIVRDLVSGPLRLEALRRWLPGVSAGALESRLSRMADAGPDHAAPPPLAPAPRRPRADRARPRARRGDRRARPLGAAHPVVAAARRRVDRRRRLLRLAPLLPPATATPADGQLALTIAGGTGDGPEHYTFIREHGRARIERRDTPSPDARMSGTEAAWVKALSPESTPSSLAITGAPTSPPSSSTCSRSS